MEKKLRSIHWSRKSGKWGRDNKEEQACYFPIEGRNAIGEMSGGVFYHNYPSGTGLVKGAIGSRNAGKC